MVNPDPPGTIDRDDPQFPNWLIDSASQGVSYLYYPEGPWTLDLADTQSNFTNGSKLEDDQP